MLVIWLIAGFSCPLACRRILPKLPGPVVNVPQALVGPTTLLIGSRQMAWPNFALTADDVQRNQGCHSDKSERPYTRLIRTKSERERERYPPAPLGAARL